MNEMKEKMKIVENELEIVQNELCSKETALIEEQRILQACQYTRDQLRCSLNRLDLSFEEKKCLQSRIEMDVDSLDAHLKQVHQQQASLHKQYRSVIRKRNKSGLLLVDKNDDLSLIHEKKNVLQSVLKSAQSRLDQTQFECKQLETQVKDIEHSLQILRNNIHSDQQQRQTALKYSQLELKLKESQSLVEYLSQQLQVPNPEMNPNRYRKIDNQKMTSSNNNSTATSTSNNNNNKDDELEANLAVLSTRLTSQKEQLLEKELIFEEVSSLTQKLRLQAMEGHDITFKLAQKMNELQSRLKKLSRKMMAAVSELSMYQASTLKLAQKKSQLQTLLQNGTVSLDNYTGSNEDISGDNVPAPFAEAEHEWKKRLLLMKRKRFESSSNNNGRTSSSSSSSTANINHQNWNPTKNTGSSTAEVRPNAYICNEIGIPKPYGAHAPFKPSVLGANLRHIRKPEHKQVII
jgi:hypothetical protein